jgi:DNA-binding beta-propeller fold protein YncE
MNRNRIRVAAWLISFIFNTALCAERAYIANNQAHTLSVCSVNPTTGLLEQCTPTEDYFDGPEDVAFNPTDWRMYITNNDTHNVSVCSVNRSDVSECHHTGSTFMTPSGIALSAASTWAYIADYEGSGVSRCIIDARGLLSDCQWTGTLFSGPVGVALNASNSKAYIVDGDRSHLFLCDINQINGLLENCIKTGVGFNQPQKITLNKANTHAYITNKGSSAITLCEIELGSGVLDNCRSMDVGFYGFGTVTLNKQETRAYFSSLGNRITLCKVNKNTGLLGECSDALGTGFKSPAGIRLL